MSTMFQTVPRRKLFHDVAAQIAQAIEAGTYPPGASLPSERELMTAFGVGRPAVREALLVLEAEGLVQIQHGRRTQVAELPARELIDGMEAAARRVLVRSRRLGEDVKEARLALEVAMARRAAECATPAGVKRLMAALADNQRAISDKEVYLRTDIAFHKTIAALTGNVIFEEAAGVILGWLARFRIDQVQVEGANLLSHDEHSAIARCIAAHDPDGAAEAMARHQLRTHSLYRSLTVDGAPEHWATRSEKGAAAARSA